MYDLMNYAKLNILVTLTQVKISTFATPIKKKKLLAFYIQIISQPLPPPSVTMILTLVITKTTF
jgi:hypothetical protein